MATTFNYYIRPSKRADNTMSVTIRITHNRKNKYIPTSIYVDSSQISRDQKTIRDAAILDSVNDRISELRKAFLTVKFPELLSVDDLYCVLTSIINNNGPDNFHLDLFDYAETILGRMETRTAKGYRSALNAAKRFIGKDRLDINEITASWVKRFRNYLESEPPYKSNNGCIYPQKSQGCRAVSSYLSCIRHIHNEARLEFNDDDTGEMRIPRQPFARKGLIPPMPITEHRTISVDEIRAIIDTHPEPYTRSEFAKDVFLLSFVLAGTNTIDLYKARVTDLDGDLFTYNRSKTDSRRYDKARITLKMLPMAMEILARHKGSGGRLFDFHSRYSDSDQLNKAVNKGMKDIAIMAGINKHITTYYARHSWATIARNVCGIERDTVNAALNHATTGNDRIADIYIVKSFDAIWRAQEAVMAEVMKNNENKAFLSAV